MLRLIIKRILLALPVLFLVASFSFVLIRLVPGGPFDADKNLPEEIVQNLKAKYHLDKPLPEQYLLYMQRLGRGDLGVSYKYVSRTVNDILRDAFPVSLVLGTVSLSLAVLIGVPLGAVAALARGSWLDTVAMFFSTLGISVPGFLIGAGLIYYFGLVLRLLPVGLWESPWHVILPALTLAFSPAAYLARLTRASCLETMQKDWVASARAKGLSFFDTVLKHILRNSLVPVVTVLGPLTAILITGSFVVEYIYAIPGMGRFFITAVMNRDYDLILGTTLVFAVLLIIANTSVDVAYHLLDPRIAIDD
jgi:oligopeptide transport system permease protein